MDAAENYIEEAYKEVMDENKDLMDVSDLCIPNVDNIQELENPINVMN